MNALIVLALVNLCTSYGFPVLFKSESHT